MEERTFVIDSYRKLPIGKYQDILKIDQEQETSEIDKRVHILSVLSDMDEDTILSLPLPTFTEMCRKADFLSDVCTDIGKTIEKEYKLGDLTLVPVMDARKVTTAQYVDFQEYAKRGESALVQILSCLLVPKGKKYAQDYDVIEVQQVIRDSLSVADVLTISAFFLTSYRKSIADMLTFSKAEAERIAKRERREMMLQRIAELQTILESGGAGSQM